MHRPFAGALTLAALAAATAVAFVATPAGAATPPVNLASAASFAVLGATTINNTGPSVISGDIGLSPGTAITGFPPGLQSSGVTQSANAIALQAQSDATAAYLDTASRTPFTVAPTDLGGSTLVAGVYQASSAMSLTGTVTLNGAGDPNSVFIFQAGSTLITAPNSVVLLENGANACNVFWQVGSSATLGTTSNFAGTILALTSASLQTGATLNGRVLVRNGAVTLDSNVITTPTCTTSSTTTTTTPASTTTTSPATTTTTTPVVVATTTPSTTTTTTPLPLGAPQTGFGGTAGSGVSPRGILGLGALGLAGLAALAAVQTKRRLVARDAHKPTSDS